MKNVKLHHWHHGPKKHKFHSKSLFLNIFAYFSFSFVQWTLYVLKVWYGQPQKNYCVSTKNTKKSLKEYQKEKGSLKKYQRFVIGFSPRGLPKTVWNKWDSVPRIYCAVWKGLRPTFYFNSGSAWVLTREQGHKGHHILSPAIANYI